MKKPTTKKTKNKKRADRYLPRKGQTLIATPGNDITIENFSNILQPQDATLEKRGTGKGLAIYDEVLTDGRCRTTLSKRRGKVVRREWLVEEASDDPKDIAAADLVREALEAIPFDRICERLLSATLKGFAVAEIVWHRNAEGYIVPKWLAAHNQQRFVFDKKWKPRLLTREDGMEGRALPERKFIVHRFGDEGNNPYGLGLGSTLFWHVLFKREGVAFWMRFLEKFASPTPFGKYPIGTLEKDQKELLNNLLAMVQSGALMAPIGTEVDFLEAKRAGDGSYENWCRYWDEQTAEVVLGGTLSTGVKGQGSRAASETHAEEGAEIADGDDDLLSATLCETLILWITELNFSNATSPRVYRPRPKNQTQEEEHKRKRHDRQCAALKVLKASRAEGYEPKDVGAWLGDVLETEMVPVEKTEPGSGTGKNDDDGHSFADGENHPIAHLINQLEQLAQDDTDGWIDDVRDVLETAISYEDAQAKLLQLSADINISPAGTVIGDALAMAELQGRSDVHDDTGVNAFKATSSKKKT